MAFGFNSAMSQWLGRYFEPLWKLFSYFNRASLEAKRQADAEWAAMSLVERFTQLMENEPLPPIEENLTLIGRRYRGESLGLDYIVILLLVLAICVWADWYFEVLSLWRLLLLPLFMFAYFYAFSEQINTWWWRHYMPRAQAEFDAHASEVREVIMDWLTEPTERQSDGEFLDVLNRYWDDLNDSKSGYGNNLGLTSSEYQELGGWIAAYHFKQAPK